jgi:hypothetical protein
VTALNVAGESPKSNPVSQAAEVCVTETNQAHVNSGRAYVRFFIYLARGSNDALGLSGLATTSLKQTSPGFWVEVASCS